MNNLETWTLWNEIIFIFGYCSWSLFWTSSCFEWNVHILEPIETFTPISEPIIAPEMISFEINQFKWNVVTCIWSTNHVFWASYFQQCEHVFSQLKLFQIRVIINLLFKENYKMFSKVNHVKTVMHMSQFQLLVFQSNVITVTV